MWAKPPGSFVTAPADAGPQTMLCAARNAMANDAPLLFTSPNGTRTPRLVGTTINNWVSHAKYPPTWIDFGPNQYPAGTLGGTYRPRIVEKSSGGNQCPVYVSPAAKRQAAINQRSRLSRYRAAEMHGGVVDRLIGPPVFFKVAGPRLSTPAAPAHLLPNSLPVARQDTLAPVVVFAVARSFPVTSGSAYPPDVAVGLALAAHLAGHAATASPKASLVVVPRGYLQAEPQLEQQLRDQRGLVQG